LKVLSNAMRQVEALHAPVSGVLEFLRFDAMWVGWGRRTRASRQLK